MLAAYTKNDFIGQKSLGRHTKYSRYKACKNFIGGNNFNFVCDPEEFPPRDPELFRIITINCNRFPYSTWSESILTCLLLSALPDVLILQEIKCMSDLRSCVELANKSHLPGNFGVFTDKENTSGLNLAIIYSLDSLTGNFKTELFQDFDISQLYSLRRPFQLTGLLEETELHFMNLHGVSRSQREHAAIRLACLDEMTEYFLDPDKREGMIIGGDWNIDSNDLLMFNHFPEFNVFISNYFSPTDHFIISKSLIDPADIGDVDQYKMDVEAFIGITPEDYLLYFSDHFPVVIDIPLVLLS